MSELNTPNWLTDSNNNGGRSNDLLATTNSHNGDVGGSGVSVPPPAGNATSSIDAEDAELPGIILYMRLVNMAAAGFLIFASIFGMLGIPSGISGIVLGIYATCGGILICCLETQLKFVRVIIAVNFGFLFNSSWRFLFYLLLGSVAYTYGTLLGYIAAISFVAVAFFNTYVLCRYPSYRKMREKIAEEEDKRIEARISKEVKKQAARQLMK